jgi:hypothetical protein
VALASPWSIQQRHKGDSLHLRKAREKALAVLEEAA